MNTFVNFKVDEHNYSAMVAFEELTQPEAKYYMLLCYGKVGSGKTHLCEALCNELKEQGERPVYREWSELIRQFKKAMRSNVIGLYDDMFDNLRQVKVLIIDDIGRGSVGSAWEWGELEDIVAYRYKNKLMTVLATNLDIKDFTERILSRFQDKSTSRMVFNEAEDYRPKKLPKPKNGMSVS